MTAPSSSHGSNSSSTLEMARDMLSVLAILRFLRLPATVFTAAPATTIVLTLGLDPNQRMCDERGWRRKQQDES
eukprot:3787873-Rhodomonas_salina.1